MGTSQSSRESSKDHDVSPHASVESSPKLSEVRVIQYTGKLKVSKQI